MSRVHANIAEFPGRRLTKQFNSSADAIYTGAPTKRNQAMGITGKNGVVSFVVLDGGTQNFILWQWHSGMAAVNSGNGWIKMGATADQNTQSCNVLSLITFLATEGIPFFIQAGTAGVTEAFVSGIEDPANPNTDKTLNASR